MGLGLYLFFSGLISIAIMSVESMYGGYILDDPTTYPYLVKLEISTNVDGLEDQFYDICGGALVDSQHVLTAAHCVMLINTTKLLPGLDVTVKAGWTGPGTGFEPIVRHVVEVEPNTRYRPFMVANDTARLKLNEPYDLSSDRVGTITWEKDAEFNRSESAHKCVTMGWGRYDEDYDEDIGDWIRWRGHVYRFFDERKDWESAQKICHQYGGYLAEVATEAENDFLANHRPKDREGFDGTWIGLTGFSINLSYEFVRFLDNNEYYVRRIKFDDFKGWDYTWEPDGKPGSPWERMCAALVYNAPGRAYGRWDDQDCSNANLDFWCEADQIAPVSVHYSDHTRALDVIIKTTWFMSDLGLNDPTRVPWEIYGVACDPLFDLEKRYYRTTHVGDSGSPLVCRLSNKPGWHLMGVVIGGKEERNIPLFWFSNVANGVYWR